MSFKRVVLVKFVPDTAYVTCCGSSRMQTLTESFRDLIFSRNLGNIFVLVEELVESIEGV